MKRGHDVLPDWSGYLQHLAQKSKEWNELMHLMPMKQRDHHNRQHVYCLAHIDALIYFTSVRNYIRKRTWRSCSVNNMFYYPLKSHIYVLPRNHPFCPLCDRGWTACFRCFWPETTRSTSPCPQQQCRGVLTSGWGWPCPWTTNTSAPTASLWVFIVCVCEGERAIRLRGWKKLSNILKVVNFSSIRKQFWIFLKVFAQSSCPVKV